jgi:hypothetical protein
MKRSSHPHTLTHPYLSRLYASLGLLTPKNKKANLKLYIGLLKKGKVVEKFDQSTHTDQ